MYGLGQGGTLLGGRYRGVRELGRGGFGHTYLTEDTHRFNELCVVKEFAPQVEGEAALEKAQQLFEREAGILYQLDHPQIPRFRELLRERGKLFLVQDYVEGPTYHDLLLTRRNYDGHFSEAEVTEFLRQVLPVLQYLHSVGVVHRDISPDNLIQRNTDGLPVLIDFGGVKQLVVNVRYQLGVSQPYRTVSGQVTRLGKVGYAPEEQLASGVVNPGTDLYALGVTALVLLTGRDPQVLYDLRTQTWRWQDEITVSPALGKVLNRLVAPRPSDRYAAADPVMSDLHMVSPYGYDPDWQSGVAVRMQPLAPPPPPPPDPTLAVGRPMSQSFPASGAFRATTHPAPAFGRSPQPSVSGPALRPKATPKAAPKAIPKGRQSSSGCFSALVGLGVMFGVMGLGWWGFQSFRPWRLNPAPSAPAENSGNPSTGDNATVFTPEERARKKTLRDRALGLKVDQSYITSLTDQLFYEKHPDLKGTQLTSRPEDTALRAEWDAIATAQLDLIEQNLSLEARQRLGRYNPTDMQRWQAPLERLHVSPRALYDLADARYSLLFPGRNSNGFVSEPVDQIWFALAQDRLQSLQSGQQLTEIRFPKGDYRQQVQGTLNPGEGQVYVLYLNQGQFLRVNLEPSADQTVLSLYVPSPTDALPYLLADSGDRTWSGELPQTGYYEIVVVSPTAQPLSYALNVAADNVTEPSQ